MRTSINPSQVPPERMGEIMSFSDLMMHLDSVFSRAIEIPALDGLVVAPFEQSHVFHLGEELTLASAIDEVWSELRDEMKGRILMPFKDITIVVKVAASPLKALPYDTWVINRFREDDLAAGGLRVFTYSVRNAALYTLAQCFSYWHDGEAPDEEDAFLAKMSELFVIDLRDQKVFPVKDGAAIKETMDNTGSMMRAIALISHPAHYVVKVSPELTPREARRAREGCRVPAKKPHFIVVDHDVLVDLRRGDDSVTDTHASPVPHQRRGHWRRLADRCKQAKLLRGDRVAVRPTLVGDRTFQAGRNMYDVQLEFGRVRP